MNRPLWIVLVLVVVLTAGACSAIGDAGSVTVLASWTDNEEAAFGKVLAAFEARTGITVRYQGTRALEQVLAADVQRGTAPDVAVLPNPGSLAAYVRSKQAQPLGFLSGTARDAYSPQWVDLQRVGQNEQYAVAVKADFKSAVWYRPATLPGAVPTTWQQLADLAAGVTAKGGTPWCVGLAAPPTSGWPGTDWIEDILLHSAGPRVYAQWAAGRLPWTAPQVRQAWLDWGALVVHPGGVAGGPSAALLTDFGDAGRPLFANPPGCVLEHQGSFVMGDYQSRPGPPRPVRDFDFFPFPGRPVAEVSADLAGLFRDTPQARKFLEFLSTPQAQAIWPGERDASAFSAAKTVPPAVYGDAVKREIANALTTEPVCFDASDLMPAAMSGAFSRAVLEYVNDPTRLDVLLGGLEDTRRGTPVDEFLDVPCGQ